jgi:aspartyl aminopeptidase
LRNDAVIFGAHTDSPGLRLKPHPETRSAGFDLLEVEIYGGALLNSWLDRDLGLAGIVQTSDGRSQLIKINEPLARVPQLAIHLDREVNEKGLVLNRQTHMRPVWSTSQGDFASLIGHAAGSEDILATNLVLFDVQPAALIGSDESMIASGRIDNQVSCWAALTALLAGGHDRPVVVALFDHEEVGSDSTTGAAGPMLEIVLGQLVAARSTSTNWFDFVRSSTCVSIDNAHALHPNYPERHDPHHAPLINHGPALKTNANQRYATSARGASWIKHAAMTAGLPLQEFVSNNAMPCGSTIGPITATRLGIETVDLGIPQLSMHSARELCGVKDVAILRDLLVSLSRG